MILKALSTYLILGEILIKRKKLTKIGVSVALSILLMTWLAGCSGQGAKSGDHQASATGGATGTPAASAHGDVSWDPNKKDKVVISVINNFYTAGLKKLAQDYMELHPETEVVVDVVADNDTYLQNIKTKFATDIDTAPDIVHANFVQSSFGSWTLVYDKGYIMDLTPMLDETNPYNDNKKVKDAFDAGEIALAVSESQGKMGFLPFDKVGVGAFYNKAIFDRLGLKPPASFEEWLEICRKLKEAGYEKPIASSWVSVFIPVMFADLAYRSQLPSLLSLPGDAAFNESTMKVNADIRFDADDPQFDQFAVLNDEKMKAFMKKNGFNTPINKQIWTALGQIGQYFQENWTSPDDQKVVTDFENQIAPIMLHGSWNVGTLNADMEKLPADKRFEWATFKLPGYANPPAGFEGKVRSLYVFGNEMGIVPKSDPDHMARVKDVYKFWYSPKQAQMLYDVTLANGNLVQGPPAILGVDLSAENAAKLEGFKSAGSQKGELGHLAMTGDVIAADKPIRDKLVLQLTDGKIEIDSFMDQMEKLYQKALDDQIKKAGYDLDPATKDTPQQ